MMVVMAFMTTAHSGLVFDGALLEGLCSTVLTHSACGIVAELLALFHEHGLLHTHPWRLASSNQGPRSPLSCALALTLVRLPCAPSLRRWRLASLVIRLLVKVAMAAALLLTYLPMVKAHPYDDQRGLPPAEWAASVLRTSSFGVAAALYLIPASLSTLSQIFPAISSWVRGWRGAPKAAVDLLEPLNRIYVGTQIHTS